MPKGREGGGDGTWEWWNAGKTRGKAKKVVLRGFRDAMGRLRGGWKNLPGKGAVSRGTTPALWNDEQT